MNPKTIYVKLPMDMVKFPPYPLTPKKETIQKTCKGKIILQSALPVTVETEEKLIAILALAKLGKTKLHPVITPSGKRSLDAYYAEIHMKDLADIINSHDYTKILNEIYKLQNTSIKYEDRLIQKVISPILEYEYDKTNAVLHVMLNKELIDCKTLIIDFNIIREVSRTTKNLYKFLMANVHNDKFKIETIKERCFIEISNPKNLHTRLKQSLQELVKIGFLKTFEIKGNFISVRQTFDICNPFSELF